MVASRDVDRAWILQQSESDGCSEQSCSDSESSSSGGSVRTNNGDSSDEGQCLPAPRMLYQEDWKWEVTDNVPIV